MNPLHALRTRLASAFEAGMRRGDGWADQAEDRRMVEMVRDRHDGPGSPPEPATIAEAVAHFRRTGEPDGWRGLKRVCYGAGMVDGKGWRLLSDGRLRGRLLALAQGQNEARKRVRCYQSLLSSYWSFPLAEADKDARAGWLALREWLDGRLQTVSRDLPRTPGWFQTLVDHRNLLRDDPCKRYGAKLLAGDGTEFRAMMVGLGIPSDSWVPEEAVLAQMRAACGLSHERFSNVLPDLLKVATGLAGISPTQALKTRCIAVLVSRYAKVPGAPEHPVLRDAAVAVIGNPWLRKASWDANVVDEGGRPDNAAREMVFGWLKRRLIKDFFELLSDDGTGDRRRLEYWLRFEPFVGDMWFALGSDTRGRGGDAFEDFRARATGRLLNLKGTTADNNAFVMRMGEYLAVEFGAKGNAFFLFRWDDLPKRIMDKLLAGREYAEVDISLLRSTSAEERLIHMDSGGKGLSWEQKFDQAICPLLGSRPDAPPRSLSGRVSKVQPERQRSAQPQLRGSSLTARATDQVEKAEIRQLVANWGLRVEDNRSKGGALWIIADDKLVAVQSTLTKWGFRYKPGKGWWKE